MNAKDLMIGDYLTRKDAPDYPECPILQVKGIVGDIYVSENGSEDFDIYGIDDLKGIPITEEILEKNFEKSVENHYGLSDDLFAVAIREVTDSIWQIEYANCEAHFPVCRNLVCHVHQLQHVLRLLGIEKQIIL